MAGIEAVVCPSHPEYDFDTVHANYTSPVECADGFVFRPQSFLLGWTIEKIQLPHRSRLPPEWKARAAWPGSAQAST